MRTAWGVRGLTQRPRQTGAILVAMLSHCTFGLLFCFIRNLCVTGTNGNALKSGSIPFPLQTRRTEGEYSRLFPFTPAFIIRTPQQLAAVFRDFGSVSAALDGGVDRG